MVQARVGVGVVILLFAINLSGCAGPERYDVGRGISDPFVGCNQSMFSFNDRLYFWVLRPVSQGYGWVLPEYARIRIRNLFFNLGMPGRALNSALQANFTGAGVEVGRFAVNTTVGVLGLWDPASSWGMEPQIEDFGQTLAVWGVASGPYCVLPVLGPMSVRDMFCKIPDLLLWPPLYIPGGLFFDRVNSTSLRIGEYEAFKEDALDPYSAMRNAWYQNRVHLISDRGRTSPEDETE